MILNDTRMRFFSRECSSITRWDARAPLGNRMQSLEREAVNGYFYVVAPAANAAGSFLKSSR
jgi:hypothetical protein